MEEIRETMEDLLKENQRLREQIARFEAEIAELRSEEHEVKETLQLARQVKEEMERTARRESDVVVMGLCVGLRQGRAFACCE